MKPIPNEIFFAWVEEEMAAGRSVTFRLKGNSMYPLLRDGRDDVVLCPCAGEELRPMDVVLFRYKGKHLLHRIMRIDGDRLYIQGDGSVVAREECLYSDVVGKVQAVVRPSGRTIPTSSWKWRVPRCLWRKSGMLRIFLLKVSFKLRRM